MNDSETRVRRRGLLRVGVGASAAATLAGSATAQDGNTTAGTESGSGGAENETTDSESGGDTESGSDMDANSTADTDGASGGGLLGSGELSSQGRLATVLSVLGLGLLSPVLFAVVLKLVYEDDSPDEEPRPPVQ